MVRNKGIDFLMFVAVLMIVNSHLESMYVGCFKSLATGGVLGDALFFFCSGYKMSVGRIYRFDNWLKRRVARIYPSVIVWDLMVAVFFLKPLTISTLFDGWGLDGYWFLKCIIIHNVAIYFIRQYFFNYIKLIMCIVWGIVLLWWIVMYSPAFAMAMFGASKFEWTYMFIFTLLGAIVASAAKKDSDSKSKLGLVVLPVSIIVHYGFLVVVNKFSILVPLRILTLITITGVVYGLYVISYSEVIIRLMEKKVGSVMAFLGALCLEVYISHLYFKTTAYNKIFPINIIIYLLVIFAVAYVIRCITRFFVQTLNKDVPYNYHNIFGM